MKRCASCGQILAQKITTCPACGSRQVAGLTHIDDYRILSIIHEGRSSLVCRAVRNDAEKPVTIRLFTDQSGVDQTVAKRLKSELEELNKLPEAHFVQHYAIKRSSTGHWYRISEWVDADNWGSIFMSGVLNDQRRMVTLFHNIASALEILHKHDHFMPYLILEDILIPRDKTRDLSVKINYKLSRFLNARATHHGPMLQKLLKCHPDIVNQRAIDFRSGIWSLGKIFVELLTANPNATDFSSKIDGMPGLDPDLAVLIKIMLSDDPDLRPQTMSRVVSALSRILSRLPHKDLRPTLYKRKPKLLKELNWFKRMVVMLLVVIVGIVSFNLFYFHRNPGSGEAEFTEFVDRYANSIGFLMVEYWLKDENRVVYKNNVEGTAFLVDPEGYLLTNRHVACPWLEDASLFRVYQQYRLIDRPLEMGHRMFFWFEGEKAFNRLPALKDSVELSDSYYLSSAFRSDGTHDLRIAGVPRTSDKTGEMVRSPFKHDFAVLKIEDIPEGLTPLPLETTHAAADIQRLSPVIILGFPLGNRTQDDHVNASVTRGHVRRTSKEIIQVDSSIYKGNSGGPALNKDGRVIGIASGVVTDQTTGIVPFHTPLSDFGLVLPIASPARFVDNLKAGHPKWNGILDFTLDAKLQQITDLAMDHKYEAAADLSESLLETSIEPALLFTSGIFLFCSNRFEDSRRRFQQLISVEGKNITASLMLYIMDWLTGEEQGLSQTGPLFQMNWQDRDEFSGYLATVLKNETPMDPEFRDFENLSERAWRTFIQGLLEEKDNQMHQAMDRFRESVLWAGANDYLYFIAFARLNALQDKAAPFSGEGDTFDQQIRSFRQKAAENRERRQAEHTRITFLINLFESPETDYDKKVETYTELMDLMPDNQTIVGRLAFFHAMHSNWKLSLEFIDRYFSTQVRETPLSLSLGLLKGEIYNFLEDPQRARDLLTSFQKSTRDPWYGIISKHLMLKTPEADLVKIAGKNPQKLITLQTALGLWAEGNKDRERAAHHYREALSTYLEGWNEYDLALSRIMRIRQNQE